jgi:cell division protein FtsW (lipid II flippase)
MLEALQNLTDHKADIKRFFTTSSLFVLVLILLHPGLLIIQRYVDGYGLPPESYKSYVAPMQAWITVLGSICLLAFLAFELKRFYSSKNWWPYVLILNDIAIVGIFYHGLRLGSNTQTSWFKILWYFFGATLVSALIYKYYLKIISATQRGPTSNN